MSKLPSNIRDIGENATDTIARANRNNRRYIAVLDDDPTGSQCVHGVSVATALDSEEFQAGLRQAGDVCFILTNTRGLPEAEAVALTRKTVRDLLSLHLDGPLDLVSRGDSTLRGHVVAEIDAIADELYAQTQKDVDAILFCPAMIEAGRTTVDDIHYALVGGINTPVGQTEFAQDRTFGYVSSHLGDFLEEKSSGAVGSITSISLKDVREGGVPRVAEILRHVTNRGWVVVNATSYADLETVALGVRVAQKAGKVLIFRSGPSFIRPLAGLAETGVLNGSDIPVNPSGGHHGLIAVGSHVALTTRQVRVAVDQGGLIEVELDVPAVLGPEREAHLAAVASTIIQSLAHSDVILVTSRLLATASRPDESLQLSMQVSSAVVDVVARARAAQPAWVIAKGGITSHEVAVRSLGIRRAKVVGQFLPGQISLLAPEHASPEDFASPFIVFPGNVGDDDSLARVIGTLREATQLAGFDIPNAGK